MDAQQGAEPPQPRGGVMLQRRNVTKVERRPAFSCPCTRRKTQCSLRKCNTFFHNVNISIPHCNLGLLEFFTRCFCEFVKRNRPRATNSFCLYEKHGQVMGPALENTNRKAGLSPKYLTKECTQVINKVIKKKKKRHANAMTLVHDYYITRLV